MHIGLATGPEVISGSTRMKAGTATKLVLNSFSTTLMIRMGRTYSNLMVSVNALNSKLRARLVRILTEATGMDTRTCENALEEAGEHPRRAGLAARRGARGTRDGGPGGDRRRRPGGAPAPQIGLTGDR